MTGHAGVPDAPFKGSAPFTADDAAFFFGRETERSVLYAHVRSRRVTVLYGASGVGKSSLVQAGLTGHLLQIAKENEERRGTPELAVAVVDSWSDSATDQVLAALARTRPAAEEHVADDALPPSGGLKQRMEECAARSAGTLFLLLDGFEDYLRRDADAEFERALIGIADSRDSQVRILISIQEEYLAKLDRFEEHVPGLLGGALRLEQLDRAGVVSAIERPLEKWNDIHGLPPQDGYRAGPGLTAEILRQLEIDESVEEAQELTIGTTYLQLVLRRLWDKEVESGSRVLRVETLSSLGGVGGIVQNYIDGSLSGLSWAGRRAARNILRYLVTPFGNKIALNSLDLAKYTGLSLRIVDETLGRLSRARIVRAVAGARKTFVYEVSHLALVPAIHEWQEQEAKKRRRNWARAGTAACIVLAAGLLFTSWRARHRQELLARAATLSEQAAALRSTNFDLSVLLAIHAMELQRSGPLDILLRTSSAQGAFVGWAGSPVRTVMPNRRANTVSIAAADGSLRFKSIGGPVPENDAMRLDWRNVLDVAFSRNGETIALVATDATVRIWSMSDFLFPIAAFGSPGATVVAITRNAELVAVGTSNGVVRLYRAPYSQVAETLTAGRDSIQALAFSPDGELLGVGSADGSVRIYSSPFRERAARILKPRGDAVHCVAFSEDNHRFAAGASNGVVDLWSSVAGDWTEQRFVTARDTRALALGPADLLAAGDEDGSIRIWSSSTGFVAQLIGHDSPMRSIAFTNSGKIVSGQDDGSVRLWTLTSGWDKGESPRARACQVANRNLTGEEWRQYFGSEPYRQTCANLPPGDAVR